MKKSFVRKRIVGLRINKQTGETEEELWYSSAILKKQKVSKLL
jgi:hypothetical protein